MRTAPSSNKPHAAIIAEASAWFVEFRAEDVASDARSRFIDWLRRSPEHIQAYLEVSGAWCELPGVDPEHKIDIGALIARARQEPDIVALTHARRRYDYAPQQASARGSRWLHPWRLAAGALGVALLASVAIFLPDAGSGRAYSTDIGEQRTIQLADGSTIELNARSRVRIHLTDRERAVTLLDGQALFRVAKDRVRPFIVRAGDAQVRAVGTEFDVYRKSDATVVTVVEGRVETTYEDPNSHGGTAIPVSAGEQLTVAPHAAIKPMRADASAATAWVQRRLIFDETPLSGVAAEFNRYNRRPLSIEDPELQKLRISGVYSSTDPASLINFLRSQSSMQVIETEREVRVVRREAR
jgi:transmembrane sensor